MCCKRGCTRLEVVCLLGLAVLAGLALVPTAWHVRRHAEGREREITGLKRAAPAPSAARATPPSVGNPQIPAPPARASTHYSLSAEAGDPGPDRPTTATLPRPARPVFTPPRTLLPAEAPGFTGAPAEDLPGRGVPDPDRLRRLPVQDEESTGTRPGNLPVTGPSDLPPDSPPITTPVGPERPDLTPGDAPPAGRI